MGIEQLIFIKQHIWCPRPQLLLLMPDMATQKLRLKTEMTEFVQLSHCTVFDLFHFSLSAVATLPEANFHFVTSCAQIQHWLQNTIFKHLWSPVETRS